MRTYTLLLVTAATLLLVLPRCCGRPNVEIKSQKSQECSSAASSAKSAESLEVKKNSCDGSYSKKASKSASSAAASSSSKSSQSTVVKSTGGSSECKEWTEKEIKTFYCKKECEKEEDYFKRIVARNEHTKTTESYVKTLNIVRQQYSTLALWYDKKYISLVKDYYTALYTKQSSECEETYFSRIVKKESFESEEIYVKRVAVVRSLFPTLPLWTEEKYFEKYTKSLYAVEYKKQEKEDVKSYIKRILEKDSCDTSDEIWAKRVYLIQEATISSCSVWYEEQYFESFKKFYEVYYKKSEKECCDAWLKRALKPFPGEKPCDTIKRVKLIHKATGNCGCWKVEFFNKIKEAKAFDCEYIKLVEKEFFSCETEIVKKSSSKSSSASSSSASSSQQESVVIKH